jgi:transcriptional regulator with XRE-family HTH domain
MTITGAQLKAARKILGLSQLELAVQFQFGQRTVAEFEAGMQTLPRATLDALRRALEAAGVEFTDGGQPGVKLKAAR